MPTISQKISRPRLVTDPVNSTNGDEPLGSSTMPSTADDVHRYLQATAYALVPLRFLGPILDYSGIHRLTAIGAEVGFVTGR